MFIPSSENLALLVPDYWKEYLLHPGEPAALRPHERDDVAPPIPIRKPEPEYTLEARRARIQGTLTVWMVVDANGRVMKVDIRRPLGMGLDDNAAQTVQTWKFKSSTRAESVSRQLRAWAGSLQNSKIPGQRYLTDKSRRQD